MTLWRLDHEMPIDEVFLRAALERWRKDQQDND